MFMRILKTPVYFFPILISLIFLSGSFTSPKVILHTNKSEAQWVFTYVVNGKIFTIEGIKAYMRNTTGGRKQLSLSNDRFTKFFFINPAIKNFDLSTAEAKEAIVRYNEPGTNFIYVPSNGYVNIKNLDEETMTLSGEFEMELVMSGKEKVIRITKGQFVVPIVFIK
jgi:hypothetical protein